MWLLVRNPCGGHVLFKIGPGFNVEDIKRGYRKNGGAVVAVYRRKHREPPDYDAFDAR